MAKTSPGLPETSLRLHEYLETLQIQECAGLGIKQAPITGQIADGCNKFMNQDDRYFLMSAIQKSENRLAADRWLGFPVRRKYFPVTRLSWGRSGMYLGKYVRGVGAETWTLVEEDHTITYRTAGVIDDPVTLTVTVNFTDVNEFAMTYPNTQVIIYPDSVTISGTTATVIIPRCRLLKPEFYVDFTDDTERPSYTTDANFLVTVDVYRHHMNEFGGGANLVWWRQPKDIVRCGCLTPCNCGSITVGQDVLQMAVPYIQDTRYGFVSVEPASLSGTTWTAVNYTVCRNPDAVDIEFMKGKLDVYDEITHDFRRMIIALTHNNLAQRYCKCATQQQYWKEDTSPLEPPVNLGLGPSTWGIYEVVNLAREVDADRGSYHGGML